MGLAVPQVAGTLLQAKAEGDAAAAKSQADRTNAQLAQQQAASVIQLGQWQAGRIRSRASQMEATQRASYAAAGVDENVGSAAQVQAGTAAMGELDALMAENNAARQAWGLKVTSQNYLDEATATDRAGRYEQEGTLLGGAGELAGDAGQAVKFATGGI